jgi:alpha,alpha-trehalase
MNPCAEIAAASWDQLKLHISSMWPTLTRDLKHALEAAIDPKTSSCSGTVSIYVSAREDPGAIRSRLARILPAGEWDRLRIEPLPGHQELSGHHGLLYLPGRYVVPGGRFNELYGWDSYFILLGLLRDGRTGLAQSTTDQLLYEVEHYGAVLNANRTYCLLRSHPPLLSRMVRMVFDATGDLAWLRSALPWLESYHDYWLAPHHLCTATGLSRYHALGEGPAPEVLASERDAAGLDHYARLCNALRGQQPAEPWLHEVYDPVQHRLTSQGYRNDRTIRESGFDLTHRFGFCGLASRDYLPVCLNSLLHTMERDIAAIHRQLESSPSKVSAWESKAASRADVMHDCFWDSSEGLFLDWNLAASRRSTYAFASSFLPLWAGWASRHQADLMARQVGRFLAPGGLLTSLQNTGCQWDAPFTWAPLVHLATRGLEAYGHHREAQTLKCRFIALAAAEFQRTGLLFEKYDAISSTADCSGKIHFGYPSNETGFGWTNGVLADLMSDAGPWQGPRHEG